MMMLLARNEGGPFCLIVLAVILVILAVAWQKRARSRDLNQAMLAISRWFHGRYQRGGWRTQPSVRIPYGDTTVLLRPTLADNGRRCMEAALDWPDPATAIYVVSKTFSLNTLRLMAKRHNVVSFGETEFERDFTVYSDDPAGAKATITGGVRSALTMLSRIRGGAITVAIAGGSLSVQKLAQLDQPAELSAFVRHAMELYDQAMLSRTVGIEFVQHTHVETLEDAKCPVCGDTIHGDLVHCGRCKTPHHRECWLYCGKCATYGCGETQFAVPRISKPR